MTDTEIGPSSAAPPAPGADHLLAAWLDDDQSGLAQLGHWAAGGPALVSMPYATSPRFLVTDAQLARLVLADQSTFRRDDEFLDALHPVLGDGLITTTGPGWRAQRRWVHGALGDGQADVAGIAGREVDTWLASRSEELLDLVDALPELHWRILLASLTGTDQQPAPRVLEQLAEIGSGSGDVDGTFSWAGIRDWLAHSDPAARSVADSLWSTSSASPKQVLDELVTLLFGGLDTTASALVWTMIMLAVHPEVQSRLRAELAGADDDLVTKSGYLHQVIKESLRLHPPTALVTRQAVDDTVLGGYTIRRVDGLVISPWVLHRSPDSWPDPLTFRPERWENGGAPGEHSYLPFGSGPRMCVGRRHALTEIAVVVARVVQRVQVELVAPAPVPRLRLTVVPDGPCLVRLRSVAP